MSQEWPSNGYLTPESGYSDNNGREVRIGRASVKNGG